MVPTTTDPLEIETPPQTVPCCFACQSLWPVADSYATSTSFCATNRTSPVVLAGETTCPEVQTRQRTAPVSACNAYNAPPLQVPSSVGPPAMKTRPLL